MKINIKRGEETESYKLIEKWDDVTLEKWGELLDKKGSTKSGEAAVTLKALSDIPERIIMELSLKDVAALLSKVAKLQSKADGRLTKTLKLEGTEYGFHPNLDELTLGEYADIETLIKRNLQKNLPELMAILYRPVVEKENGSYSIEPYDPSKIGLRSKVFNKMSGQQVNNALVFFWSFAKELLKILPLYLMEVSQDLIKATTRDLQRSGGGLE
tara:strand:- start:2250 stop:2891 length:642 start_codon:yes stop_codon:yes gene_type:complete